MKNKKLMMAVAAITMCAASFSFAACNNHTHNYEWTTTKAPTCVSKGEETGVCPDDQDTVTREIEADPSAHAYGEWVITKPTMELTGKAYKTCGHDAAHVVQVDLPKLTDTAYKAESVDANTTKFTLAHELGDVVFEANVSHVYTGDLTLVTKPTFNSFGLATKACFHGGSDVLKVYIPTLTMQSDDLVKVQTKAPTAETCGKATYTFTYGEEKVEFEADIPATTSAEDMFLDMYAGNNYKFAAQVGKVVAQGVSSTDGKESKPSSYNYECGNGFTHVRMDGDYADYYYYETGDADVPVKIIKVDENDEGGKNDPVWYSSGSDEAAKEFDAAGMKGARFIYSNISAFGIDTFAKLLYNAAPVDANGEPVIQYTSWEKDGETVYAFSYRALKTIERASDSGTVCNDDLTITTVAFTVSDTGMAKSWDISILNYTSPNYNEDGEVQEPEDSEGTERARAAGAINPALLSQKNPIKGYEDGNYYVYPDTVPNRTAHYTATVQTKAQAGTIESPYDFAAITAADTEINFNIKCGDDIISENGVLEVDTAEAPVFSIVGLPENIPASLIDYKLYQVVDYGEGPQELEVDFAWDGSLSGFKSTSVGGQFTLYARKCVGYLYLKERKLAFRIRGRKVLRFGNCFLSG